MVKLDEVAARCSGVATAQAFRLNELNLYEVLGHDWFVRLSTNFYERVFDDLSAPWFRELFLTASKEDAIRNQYEWLIQRCGGPPLYNERRGHPGLLGSHAGFDVTEAGAERWLLHMERALAETADLRGDVSGGGGSDEPAFKDARCALLDFFQHTAHFIAAGQRMREGKNVLGSASGRAGARQRQKRTTEASASVPKTEAAALQNHLVGSPQSGSFGSSAEAEHPGRQEQESLLLRRTLGLGAVLTGVAVLLVVWAKCGIRPLKVRS
ncbi:unnamed protein product [Polarella glacialis]|uniref:Globin n=1 Tax=Polarella glacialis TaxID=89957 RepID=A0A813HCI3_POLGL|nr:unnamed protein product [Polarella glacialis]